MSESSTLPSSTEPDRQSGLPTPNESARRETAERKPIFHVPHDPVRHFVGRDELLEELRNELSSGRRAALTQAITGLDGIGKTQLAVQYAHRFFADYDVVWWLNAESEMILRAELAALAVPLELPEKDQSDQDRVRLAVLDRLSTHDRWLLIFDNAEQPEDLRGCLPHEAGGHVIIPSRNPNWLAVATPLVMRMLKPSPSAELLISRSGRNEPQAAEQLAHELGGLPIFLTQAAANIETTGKSIAEYLELFTHHRERLWATPVDSVTRATFRTTACHTPRAYRSRTTPCLLASRQPARGSASQLARTKVAWTCQRA